MMVCSEMAGICWGIGDSSYAADADQFGEASQVVNGFIDYAGEQGIDTEAVTAALDTESEDFDPAVAKTELAEFLLLNSQRMKPLIR